MNVVHQPDELLSAPDTVLLEVEADQQRVRADERAEVSRYGSPCHVTVDGQ
jgi:hypothetical protein